MKSEYRLFRRGKNRIFWAHHNETGKQSSLGTSDRSTAERIMEAKNASRREATLNLHLARAYLQASDPDASKRTWQAVMDEILRLKRTEAHRAQSAALKAGTSWQETNPFGAAATERRWKVAVKDQAFDEIRHLPLLETRSDHFLRIVNLGKPSTNAYLRRIQNWALGMGWLAVPILPKRSWPRLWTASRRAITREEHERIVERETNPERRNFYQLAWELGASQSDLAHLKAENIDWKNQVIRFTRKKTQESSAVHFGERLVALLKTLPTTGDLFPYLRTVRAGDRATEFKQRCKSVGISGISLHSYRYAWAQRAKDMGYPERFAQIALGHSSAIVHRVYAKGSTTTIPSLDSFARASGFEAQ